MVFIPFICFISLTLYWWKKHKRIDVCIYMSALYTFTAFCAIILVLGNMLETSGVLFDDTDIELNVIPTILFIALHILGMLPFSLLYGKDIKSITVSMPHICDCFAWMFILLALLNLYLIADSTLDILQGDLKAVRQAHSDGLLTPADLKAEAMPAVLRYFYLFNTSTLLALPLFFYYLCFTNKSWLFKVLLFFSSLSVPLQAIQAVDRTEFVFYGMMFIYCLVFFWRFLSHKIKRNMAWLSIPFVSIVLVYLVAVSQARFEDEDGGAEMGALQYAGQNYLNFCYFWENANTDEIATERELPLINHLLGIDSNGDRRGERSGKQGFFISVFATYIGDILLDIGPLGMAIWTIFFFLIAFLIIQSAHREEFTIGEVLAIFVLSAIPIFGIFYYRYYSFRHTIMIIVVACIYFLSKYKIGFYAPKKET